MNIYIYIYMVPPQKPTFSHFVPVFTVVFAFLKTCFFKAFFDGFGGGVYKRL